MILYKYIGQKEILKQISKDKVGKIILSESDIKQWIKDTDQSYNIDNEITVTFIIDSNQNLRINDRRSEHVVCANGEEVLLAGEMTFKLTKSNNIRVSNVTNLSTGYCPSTQSWYSVSKALSNINIEFPAFFTKAFIFRICDNCGNINVVKDNFFVCFDCGKDLKENE